MSRSYNPKEFKLTCLRECDRNPRVVDTPAAVAEYWDTCVKPHPYFMAERETFVVLFVNTRRRAIGHHLVSQGTIDTILVHPREVFQVACIMNAAAVILMHNHPSGDPAPSEADIKVTRDLIRAGQLLKIEVLDHVIMGIVGHASNITGFASLRELGYFYT